MRKNRKLFLISLVAVILAAIPAYAVFQEKTLPRTLDVLHFELKMAYEDLLKTRENIPRREGEQHKNLIKLIKDCKAKGVVYQSDKVREWELAGVVSQMITGKGLKAEPQAVDMLCNSIGSDLSRLNSEIEKLMLSLQGRSQITLDDVTQHIGISREFNVWELQSAIAKRDALKVEMIRRYFERNPKMGPSQMVISTLFGFFSNLMLAHYSPDKSQAGLMKHVGCSFPSAKDLLVALKIYNGWKTMQNISILREFDARSKGGRGGTTPDPELLKDLLYQLMH